MRLAVFRLSNSLLPSLAPICSLQYFQLQHLSIFNSRSPAAAAARSATAAAAAMQGTATVSLLRTCHCPAYSRGRMNL